MHEKSLALTLLTKLSPCRGLPKTSLTHVTERQTDAGGATITSYIMINLTSYFVSTQLCHLADRADSNSKMANILHET